MGFKPDALLLDNLNLPQGRLSRIRRAQLNMFSLAGEDGRAASWKLHDKLLEKDLLDASVARTMYVCVCICARACMCVCVSCMLRRSHCWRTRERTGRPSD